MENYTWQKSMSKPTLFYLSFIIFHFSFVIFRNSDFAETLPRGRSVLVSVPLNGTKSVLERGCRHEKPIPRLPSSSNHPIPPLFRACSRADGPAFPQGGPGAQRRRGPWRRSHRSPQGARENRYPRRLYCRHELRRAHRRLLCTWVLAGAHRRDLRFTELE